LCTCRCRSLYHTPSINVFAQPSTFRLFIICCLTQIRQFWRGRLLCLPPS
jgi:hypothetical protein